ncbi:hypothetical protein BT96DRAFT_950344 [Gymnopus androsaceus JB14]|uniref:Uncharacterized protein n=1 Tax=Gymnopus androsaceus JB14 TaxID=1447944 RepID=A0A6A4GHI2_9AGAR|nr:hypothetical protein BT96DRAFT_950344 [Gymnopus androsaceus JB14]
MTLNEGGENGKHAATYRGFGLACSVPRFTYICGLIYSKKFVFFGEPKWVYTEIIVQLESVTKRFKKNTKYAQNFAKLYYYSSRYYEHILWAHIVITQEECKEQDKEDVLVLKSNSQLYMILLQSQPPSQALGLHKNFHHPTVPDDILAIQETVKKWINVIESMNWIGFDMNRSLQLMLVE